MSSAKDSVSISEIVIGLSGGHALRLTPRASGLTIVPIDLGEVRAEHVARAVRDALASPRRDSSSAQIPFVRVALKSDAIELSVADDAYQHARMLTESRGGRLPLIIEASTSELADDARLELVLSRVAAAFGADNPEDLAPALAHGGKKNAGGQATPKEISYLRAHTRATALARQIRALDDQMTASVVPDWLWIAAGLGGLGVLMTAVTLFHPELRVVIVPAMIALLVLGLIAYGWRSFRELKTRAALREVRARLREEREAARAEVRELAAMLRERGLDPDEVMERLAEQRGPANTPTVLWRAATSSEEVTSLGGLDRQVLLFVDRSGVLAGEDYGDAVRSFAPPEPAATLEAAR